jgi:hypothetical protein
MTTQTVTTSYLLGINEGRQFKRRCIEAGDTIDRAFIADHIATIERVMAQGFGSTMRDFMRGERDFWRNQLKNL